MAPKARKEPKNQGTPAADFAEFLRVKTPERFSKQGDTTADEARERLVAALKKYGVDKIGIEAVRKWEQGATSPPLKDFGAVAKAFGYRDWFALIADIKASI